MWGVLSLYRVCMFFSFRVLLCHTTIKMVTLASWLDTQYTGSDAWVKSSTDCYNAAAHHCQKIGSTAEDEFYFFQGVTISRTGKHCSTLVARTKEQILNTWHDNRNYYAINMQAQHIEKVSICSVIPSICFFSPTH